MKDEGPIMPRSAAQPRQSHVALAERLADQLRLAEMKAGDRLPELWVASRCAVSRTLARAALGVLEAQGVTVYRRGRGHFLQVDPADMRPLRPAGDDGDLKTAILRDRIARRLADRITIPELMRRYEQPRPAVTKALARMAEDRLVERGAGQRWHFRPLLDGPAALADSYRLRLVLEPAALLEPGFAPDRRLLADLRTRMDGLLSLGDRDFDVPVFDDLDRSFHEALAAGCGNRFVRDGLIEHLHLRRTPAFQSPAPSSRLRESVREHLRILDQVERARLDAAADLMRVHLQLSRSMRPSLSVRGAPALVKPAGPATPA